jgi:hypothetical protein
VKLSRDKKIQLRKVGNIASLFEKFKQFVFLEIKPSFYKGYDKLTN